MIPPDETTRQAADALRDAIEKSIQPADVKYKLTGRFSVWLKVRSTRFAGLDSDARDDLFWNAVKDLPDDITQRIGVTALVAPGEARNFAEFVFEEPGDLAEI